MEDSDSKIRDELLRAAVEDWLEKDNPFSDIVFKDGLVKEVTERLDEVDRNDVEYVWKLMTEEGYFRKRGKSRRITAKEIEEAETLGLNTPLDKEVQNDILRVLADVERKNVNRPKISRDELIDRLNHSQESIDYNLFYCRSKGWADVDVYISSNPWEDAEITRFGRDRVNA